MSKKKRKSKSKPKSKPKETESIVKGGTNEYFLGMRRVLYNYNQLWEW